MSHERSRSGRKRRDALVGEFLQRGVCIGKVFDVHGLLLEITVEKGVVNGLAIFKQDDAQGTVIHFRDARPAPDPPIRFPFPRKE